MNKKAKLLPIVILLAFFSLFYFYNLTLVTALPDDDWGRATKVNGSSSYPMQQYSFVDDSRIHVYLPGDEDVRYTVLDENYKKIEETIIPIDPDVNTPIWGNGKSVVYMQGEKLHLYENEKTSIIDEGVESFSPAGDRIVYWKEQEAFAYNASDKKTSLLAETEEPISHIVSAKGDGSLFISTNPTPFDYSFYLLKGEKLESITSWSSSTTATVENILYDSNGEEGSILIESFKVSQGERFTMANLLSFSMKDMKLLSENEQMHFADGSNGDRLANPRYLNFRYMNGEREFLFVSEGQREGKKSGYNVYFADSEEDGRWIGYRRSTSAESSMNPQWAGESHILWQTFDGKEYETFGTFDGKAYVDSTMAKTKEDYQAAMYEFISGVFSSVVMVFFGFVWVIPLIFFYVVMMFVRRDDFETDKTWAEPVGILIYIGTVVFVFNGVLSERTFSLAPEYLIFPYAMVIWPLIIGALSYIFYKFVIDKDIGLFAGISYYIGLNIIMMTGLYGPYLI